MKRKVGLKVFLIILTSIIFISLFSLLAFNTIYIKSKVSGNSMLPTLHNTDRIFTNRYNQGKIGDIVVANISKQENWINKEDGDYVIKTLIAKEGDRVKLIKTGNYSYELYVNNKLIDKKEIFTTSNSYLHFSNYIAANFQNTDRIQNGEIIVQKNEIFIIGDNWEVSYDCFSCGPINKKSIVGKVDIIVPKNQNIVLGTIKGLIKAWF